MNLRCPPLVAAVGLGVGIGLGAAYAWGKAKPSAATREKEFLASQTDRAGKTLDDNSTSEYFEDVAKYKLLLTKEVRKGTSERRVGCRLRIALHHHHSRHHLSLASPPALVQEIDIGVQRVADELERRFAGEKIVICGILKGAFVFITDLTRRLKRPYSCYFVEVRFER